MSIRRDYKPASTWQRRRQSARRHGLLVVTLVLVGLFGGLLAYIKDDRTQQHPAVSTVAPKQPAPSTGSSAAPQPPPAAPEIVPAPLKPKYDFYTELPKRQINFQRDLPGPRDVSRPPSARPWPVIEPSRKPAPPAEPQLAPTMIQTTTGQGMADHS
ncbi:MAG: hypothetical protein KDJ54_13455 [Candidatus Competibacteraceae bacterium]|nr:hypothetical protein [Candidatus Competibacteraceae bacterium]